jgi:molybdopterin synthase sulfur carrier subunit
MKKITLLFFAGIRQRTGVDSIEIETDAETVSEILGEIKKKYDAINDENLEHVRFALNEEFVSRSEKVSDGDSFALIPPVAGG